MRLVGLDLAWQTNKNPSAMAVGELRQGGLHLIDVEPAIIGLDKILAQLSDIDQLQGVAIDASLIIPNQTGQRACEALLGKDYASRRAGCHATNQTLYPNALSVQLSLALQDLGFEHLLSPSSPISTGDKVRGFQLECYPHPSLIECFGLPERLAYKKGKVADKRNGQVRLAQLISQLSDSPILPMTLSSDMQHYLDAGYIQSLRGKQVKTHEDLLDSLICLYIAGLFQIQANGSLYGNKDDGYIWVPQVLCV